MLLTYINSCALVVVYASVLDRRVTKSFFENNTPNVRVHVDGIKSHEKRFFRSLEENCYFSHIFLLTIPAPRPIYDSPLIGNGLEYISKIPRKSRP